VGFADTAVNSGDMYTTLVGTPNCENTSTGKIETSVDNEEGMMPGDGGTASNFGRVITHGQYAYGIYANNGARATNSGTITTEGYRAWGMLAWLGSTATNESGGIIITSGGEAHGMYADGSTATNSGTITTSGQRAYGMYAYDSGSEATNWGSITTYGKYAYGMSAYNSIFGSGSTAINKNSITTKGEGASGMHGSDSTITNDGSITTEGNNAHGMYARGTGSGSTATNKGSITTKGEGAYGMYARGDSTVTNESGGTITTYGIEAHGMYIDDVTGTNSGEITVTGEGADAAYVDSSTFTNSGTLDSLHANAINSVNGTVNLNDGTRLSNSHSIVGDEGSTLNVTMNEDLSAVVKDFGTFNKNGTGTLTLEGGSSAGTTYNNAGTLKIDPDTTFETNSYTQTADASLHLYVPKNQSIDPPLYVNGATFAGNVTIDYSSNPLPGRYKYIYVAGEKTGDFDSVSFVNPGGIYLEEELQWEEGNSWSYIGYVEYAFSEQALGLVAAIEDWSLLRWVMANHLQDVASESDKLEVGKKAIYAHLLGSNTERDPSGKSSLGYDADTKGLSLGFDKKVNDTTAWGVYAGYTEKDIDFTDVASAASDWEKQDTWHFGAYLSKRFNDRWVVSETLTYRTTDHDSFRRQADGDAKGSFDSWAVTNDIRVGYIAQEGKGSRWEIVPEFGLNIGYFERGGYTETNGYTYGDYDTTVTEGVIGVRMQGEYLSKDGLRCAPRLRLSYVKVLSGDDVTIDQSWHGRTRWYTEDLDDDYFVVDAGVTLYNAKNFDVSLNYNGRFGNNTDSQGGWLRLEWKF
jgi:hypothetical protein